MTGSATYAVGGVRVLVRSDVPDALSRVEASYGALRAGVPAGAERWIDLRRRGAGAVVRDHTGYDRAWPDAHGASLDALGRVVHAVLEGLHAQGVTPVHAGAVVHRGHAAIVAGPSGRGKTTLVLGLVARGLGLLSDELALVSPGGRRILPFRRAVHVRPGTADLVPGLRP